MTLEHDLIGLHNPLELFGVWHELYSENFHQIGISRDDPDIKFILRAFATPEKTKKVTKATRFMILTLVDL